MTSIRRTIAAAAVLASIAGLAQVAPAQGATSGSTPVTFAIPAAELSISVSTTSVGLGTLTRAVAGGASGTASLGTTTVQDARTAAARTFTVQATSAGFTKSGDASPSISGSKTSVAIPATGSGAAAFDNATSAALPAVPGLNLGGSGQTILVGAVVAGVGTVTYNPTVTITLADADLVAGNYSGSITQTVS